MAEKETKKMAEETKIEGIHLVELKQKQSVLNLDTMSDSEILLVYNKVEPNTKAPVAVQLAAVSKLVHPDEKRVTALCNFATSENYRAAKEKALGSGNYMSTALRSKLTDIMSGIVAFADNSAKDNFAYWQERYKDSKNPDGQAKAKKLLDRAKLMLETSEFETM